MSDPPSAQGLMTTEQALKLKKTGALPTGRRWKGTSVPFFFVEESAERFGELEMRDDDVIMSSLGKGGTTWVHKILFLLMHGMDDEGNRVAEDSSWANGQIYPESCPTEKPAEPLKIGHQLCLDELMSQPAPRLFSTHLWGKHLPKQLVSPDGKGKLVIVLRNLKDVITSLHFFMGEAKDNWLGNEYGIGSFNRFIAEDSPNAYGSSFVWIKEQQDVVDALKATGRVHVVYFEQLKENLSDQVSSIAEFLNVPLTPAKCKAIVDACTFSGMKADQKQMKVTLRKGEIGDWKNYLDDATWARFDEVFERRCGAVDIAQPLRQYHAR